MKRTLCLILSLIMILGIFASCSQLKDGDKGPIVTMYLCDQIFDYDPIVGFTDTSKAQVISLVFEGLTTLDANGNWKKAMMKSYEYKKPAKDGEDYKLIITLDNSKWSDGRTVQANDFVYAWKRVIEPTNKCEAASMLYDIKNAYDIKMGNATVDDLGVYAVETYKLEVDFTYDINVDEFFKKCASVALVPLREDKADNEVDWAKRASTMVTNGPFDVRKITYGQELILERSSYYRRDTEANEALDKYVIPYRLIVYFNYGNQYDQLIRYEEGDLFYLSQIALEARGDYAKKAQTRDAAITTSLYFNTENKLFKSADARRALSMAIDRAALADQLVFAKAATGYVPYGVDNANASGSFRKEGGDVLDTAANVSEAKSLLKSAGVSGGSFTLSVRDDEYDVAVANYVAEAWNSLGFKVKVKTLTPEAIANVVANQSVIFTDTYNVAFAEGDFDVILVDSNMLSPDAFSALAPFAPEYSGNGVDMYSENYDTFTHITGYNSEEYNALIDEAFAEKDGAKRAEILHKAEELLLNDMPVVPVVFVQHAYVTSNVLSGVTATYWGSYFKKANMKDYLKYKESILAASTEDEVGNDD